MHMNGLKLTFTTILFAVGLGCTHQRTVTPGYTPQIARGIQPGSICPAGQIVAVYAVNQSPDGASAGTTKAGIHTFEYSFANDPAQVLKLGLEQALQVGGCRLGQQASANLSLGLLRLEAKGLTCGFFTCDGSGQSMVQATLADAAGRPLAQRMISSTTTKGCGMAICNETEASEIASDVLTDTIQKTVAAFAVEIKTYLAGSLPAPAPSPQTGSQPVPRS
jgi:hypothetical protein